MRPGMFRCLSGSRSGKKHRLEATKRPSALLQAVFCSVYQKNDLGFKRNDLNHKS